MMKDCNLPVDLGQGPLTQKQVEKLWISDRVSLIDCYYRHKAFVEYILLRDGLISNPEGHK
jgi:hypothetical protein